LVRIDGFRTDVIPEGTLLITLHKDQPGMIGKVGTILGDNKINIAGMDVGREAIGGRAVMVLNIDTPVSDNLLKEIRKVPGMAGVQQVVL
jgi:D-3-phosphoglycerate dehydrogenase